MTLPCSIVRSGRWRQIISRRSSAAPIRVVSHDRVKNLRNAFKRALEDYVGSTQIHLIGQDSWAGYPTWRRENGKGRFRKHISDATIQFEMGALNAAMNFAITKRLVPASFASIFLFHKIC
jgi:hypothetical protein